jgi:hypothetical protein
MAGANCGKLDLDRISEDDLITQVDNVTKKGLAWVRAEVDEKVVLITGGDNNSWPKNGTYAVVKFNEGCFVDICNDAVDFNRSLTLLSNLLQTAASTADGQQPDPGQSPNPDSPPSPSESDDHKGQTICGVNIGMLTEGSNQLDTNSINDAGFQPAAIKPYKFNIPMRYNNLTYGPYLSPNFGTSFGGTEVQQNNDLCPWIFGSANAMNVAGTQLVQNMVIGLVKSETGSVTIPGLPTIANLGAAIAQGPNLSGMNVSVGSSGITTNYEFKTFTPRLGAITKMGIDRFKELAQAKQEQLRFLRADNLNQLKINKKLNRLQHQRQQNELNNRNAHKASLQRIIAGEIYDWNSDDKNEPEDEKSQRTIVGVSTLSKSIADMVYDFDKKAYMSLDGIFGPVSKYGDGSLPRFSNYEPEEITSPHLASPILPQPPFTANGECSDSSLSYEVYNLDLTQPYFDPLQNKFVEHKYHDGEGAGHVIDLVGRNQELTSDGLITNFYNPDDEGRYSEDYRFLGMRGPIVLHSWGYDLDGKPIPNAADSVDDTKDGNFKTTGLKDQFIKDWLKKPATWPVAPIDLRFDRKRGVWVSPQPYKIVVAKIVKEVPAFGSGLGVLVNYGNKLYDTDGNEITTDSEVCCVSTTGECNWIDVVTNVCLTPQGLIIQKKKIQVLDIEDDTTPCFTTIDTTSCSGGGPSPTPSCPPYTIDCAKPEEHDCPSPGTDMNMIEIVDRIGRRHKPNCYVYAYYDTSTAKYIVLQN